MLSLAHRKVYGELVAANVWNDSCAFAESARYGIVGHDGEQVMIRGEPVDTQPARSVIGHKVVYDVPVYSLPGVVHTLRTTLIAREYRTQIP